jgi:hypothetical protein
MLFPVCDQGCAYLSLQVTAIKLHLALLMSSSHRFLIIHSPQLLDIAWIVSIPFSLIYSFHDLHCKVDDISKWLESLTGTNPISPHNGPWLLFLLLTLQMRILHKEVVTAQPDIQGPLLMSFTST